MEKGTAVEVLFFGDSALAGILADANEATATITFGIISGGWSVTVPRKWIRNRDDRLLVELA